MFILVHVHYTVQHLCSSSYTKYFLRTELYTVRVRASLYKYKQQYTDSEGELVAMLCRVIITSHSNET